MDKKQKKDEKSLKNKKINTEIVGLNIDKMEYQQIVLSNSNMPDKDYFRRNY